MEEDCPEPLQAGSVFLARPRLSGEEEQEEAGKVSAGEFPPGWERS